MNNPYSPCVGCCTTALGDDICGSCNRTQEEVDTWNFMTAEEREKVWERLNNERT